MNEIQEAILLGAKEIHNLREQNKELQKRLDFMIEQNDKKQIILDKIKLNIEQNVIRMKNGKLLVELDVNEINELLEEIK